MTLGIVIPVIEEELENFYSNIKEIQLNFKLAQLESYQIVVVLQSKNNITLPCIDKVGFEITSFYSVSNARNIGLDKLENKCSYIYLLDQDAIPSVEFLIEAKTNMGLKYDIWSGKINWVKNKINKIKSSNEKNSYLKTFFIPYNSFLGCYFFKSELIKRDKIRFNDHLGPAENTYLKSGEDVLFLCDLLSKNKVQRYKFYPNLYINHPKRTTDNSKTILYLDGQAAIYKHLLFNNCMLFQIRLGSLIYLFLFMSNGFFKFLKGEEKGFFIFKRRLSSIFKRYDINN